MKHHQISTTAGGAETTGGQDEIRPWAHVDCPASIHHASASSPTTQNARNSSRRYVPLCWPSIFTL